MKETELRKELRNLAKMCIEVGRKQERESVLKLIDLEIDCYLNNDEKFTSDCFKLFKQKLNEPR